MSKESFLSRDQGVRAVMVYANDFFYTLMDESIFNLNVFLWEAGIDDLSINDESLQMAIQLFKRNELFMNYLHQFAELVVKIDWRTPSAPFDREEDRRNQLIYFGCEDNPECDFMSWSRPVAEKCPKCGGYMVIKGNKIVCADEQCGYVTDRKNVEKDSE